MKIRLPDCAVRWMDVCLAPRRAVMLIAPLFIAFAVGCSAEKKASEESSRASEPSEGAAGSEGGGRAPVAIVAEPSDSRLEEPSPLVRWGLDAESLEADEAALARLEAAYRLEPGIPAAPEAGMALSSEEVVSGKGADAADLPLVYGDSTDDPEVAERLDLLARLLSADAVPARAHYLRAHLLSQLGHGDSALVAYSDAFAAEPSARVARMRALEWTKRGEFGRALADYALAVSVARDDFEERKALVSGLALAMPRIAEGQLLDYFPLARNWLESVKADASGMAREELMYAISSGMASDDPANFGSFDPEGALEFVWERFDRQAEAFEKRERAAARRALFAALPPAPEPWGGRLEAAAQEESAASPVLQVVERWRAAESRSPLPGLYGSSLLLQLDRPIPALRLLEESLTLTSSQENRSRIFRLKAVAHGALGELERAHAADVAARGTADTITPFWLQLFVRRNTDVAFAQLNNGDESLDYDALAWLEASDRAADEGNPLLAAFAAANALLLEGLDPAKAEGLERRLNRFRQSADEPVAVTVDGTLHERLAAYDEALRRDPSRQDLRRQAFAVAREAGLVLPAAVHLRQLWVADALESRDYAAALELALQASDWELLLSIAQHAVAEEASVRRLYFLSVAMLANRLPHQWEGRLTATPELAVLDEAGAWLALPSVRRGSFASGSLTKLKEADATLGSVIERILSYEKSQEASGSTLPEYYRRGEEARKARREAEMAALRASPPQGLENAVAFLDGQIDAADYLQRARETEDVQTALWARVLTTFRRWHGAEGEDSKRLSEVEYTDFVTAAGDGSLPLHLRLMARRFLIESGDVAAAQPLRSDDWRFIGADLGEDRLAAEASRTLVVSSKSDLIRLVRSEATLGFSEASFADVPLATIPGGSVHVASLLAGSTVDETSRALVDATLPETIQGTLDRTLALADDSEINTRWDGYDGLGRALDRHSRAFSYDKEERWTAPVASALAPLLNKRPDDAGYCLIKVKVDLQRMLNPLSAEAQARAKRFAETYVDSYAEQRQRYVEATWNGGLRREDFVAMMEAAQPKPTAAEIAAKREREERAQAYQALLAIAPRLKADFEAAMSRRRFQAARSVAYQLVSVDSDFVVRWALGAPNPSLFDLRFAYEKAWFYQHKSELAKMIAAEQRVQDRLERLRFMREEQARRQRSIDGYRSNRGHGWGSYVSDANERYNSMMRSQQQRDIKNGIFYDLR